MFKFQALKFLSVGLLLISSAAAAATGGSVILGGSVSSTAEVTSSTTTEAGTLDLMSGVQVVKVADIEMSTNNDTGLTLTATSGNLVKAGGVSIPFQVHSVANNATAPVAGVFLVASGTSYTVASSAAGSVDKDLYILYTPAGSQDPGNYGATITLSVLDN